MFFKWAVGGDFSPSGPRIPDGDGYGKKSPRGQRRGTGNFYFGGDGYGEQSPTGTRGAAPLTSLMGYVIVGINLDTCSFSVYYVSYIHETRIVCYMNVSR
jgi:hypothetical protein